MTGISSSEPENGISLTSVTVIETISLSSDDKPPSSVTLNIKLSLPLKSILGI